MANMQYAIGRPFDGTTYTQGDFWAIQGAVSSSAQAGYPASNLQVEHIGQSWRSSGTTGTHYCGIDLGASRAVQGVLIEGINCDTFNIRIGDTGTSGDANVKAFSGVSANPRTKRRNGFAGYAGSTPSTIGTGRYVGVSMSGSTTDGAADFEVGRITAIQSLRTLTRNWSTPYRYEVQSIGSAQQLPGGQIASVATSGLYVLLDMSGEFNSNVVSEVADANAFQAMTSVDRVVQFEARTSDTDSTHAYYCMLDSPTVVSESPPILSVSVSLREVL